MNKLLLCTFLLSGIFECAYSQLTGSRKDYLVTESGLMCRFHIHNDGESAKTGDVMRLSLVLKTGSDSILLNSYAENKTLLVTLKPAYPGSFEEGLGMLSVGDSAEFLLNADSAFKFIKSERPSFIPAGGKIYIIVKVHDVINEVTVSKREREQAQKYIQQEKESIKKYLADNNVRVTTTPSGLMYTILKSTTGKQAVSGNTVKAHYTGSLLNGEVFDNTREKNEPFEFILGAGMVIKGWDEGLSLMKKGEIFRFIIPSDLAYGDKGVMVIGPYTSIIFEIELLDIRKRN